MSIWELIIIAIGLSMDAFAIAISKGLAVKRVNLKSMLIVGLYFGSFQAAMPLLGYAIGFQFADMITSVDHWIAFGLLLIIGGKMIFESVKREGCPDRACEEGVVCSDRECPLVKSDLKKASLHLWVMLPLALATSIDALAVGVSFAFLRINVVWAASLIGGITLLLSAIGVKIGSVFGTRFKAKAEFVGGLILILMGTRILLDHLNLF